MYSHVQSCTVIASHLALRPLHDDAVPAGPVPSVPETLPELDGPEEGDGVEVDVDAEHVEGGDLAVVHGQPPVPDVNPLILESVEGEGDDVPGRPDIRDTGDTHLGAHLHTACQITANTI